MSTNEKFLTQRQRNQPVMLPQDFSDEEMARDWTLTTFDLLEFGKKTEPHWDDILRLIASLKPGRLNVMSIMKTLQTGDRPTSLAQAIAEIGRADKTIHMLTYLGEERCNNSTV